MKKVIKAKILPMLISMLLVVGVLSTPLTLTAYAASPWDGTNTDTSWYDDNQTIFYIRTAEELAGMAKLVNEDHKDFNEKTVVLLNDINLGNMEWKPIGHGHLDRSFSVLYSFAGSFNGNGYTVSGLKNEVNYTGSDDTSYYVGAAGLFGFAEPTTVISNLTVEGEVNVTKQNNPNNLHQGNAGGIVGYNTGTVTNCVNRASVKGQYATGGITGFNGEGTVTKCTNEGTVTLTASNTHVGGIAGVSSEGSITFCTNNGEISSTSTDSTPNIGGILGSGTAGEVLVANCYNTGLITTLHGKPIMGGIVGGAYFQTNIVSCYNAGLVQIKNVTPNSEEVGALVGSLSCGGTPKPSIDNSFFLATSFSKGIGSIGSGTTVDISLKTAGEMKSPEFLALLNAGNDYWVLVPGKEYPELKFAQVPTVQSLSPASTDIALSGNIEITFDKEMRESTNGTVSIDNGIGALSGGSWTNATTFAVPYTGLASNTTYTVTVSDFNDTGGKEMTADSSHSFTTMLIAAPTINGSTTASTNRTVTLGYSSPETVDFAVAGAPTPNPLLDITNDGGTGATISGTRLTIPTGLAVGDYEIKLESTNSAGTATHIINFKVSALPIAYYTITVNAGTGGTASGDGSYAENDTATVTATADTGYIFVNWTENDVEMSTSASYSFGVTADRTLIAHFKADGAEPPVEPPVDPPVEPPVDPPVDPTVPTKPSTNRGSSDSTAGSNKADASPNLKPAVTDRIFTKPDATKLFHAALAAKPAGQSTPSLRAQNYTRADKAAFSELASLAKKNGVTLTVHFDTVVGKAVSYRLSVNPAEIRTDLDLTVKIAGGKITLPKFSPAVEVAVKMPVGITLENLNITQKGNDITETAKPRLDKNGYLHFTTTGGEILLGK